MQRVKHVLRIIANIVLHIYMILIIAVMPFYFTDGYGRIGSNKYEFFNKATSGLGKAALAFAGICLLLQLARLVRLKMRIWRAQRREQSAQCQEQPEQRREQSAQCQEQPVQRQEEPAQWETQPVLFPSLTIQFRDKLSVTDIFALLYGVAVIASYLHSDYKEMTQYGNAWAGADGWYMGLATQLMFLAVYFVISRLWKPNKWLPALWLPVTFAVYFLGYCNRFSFYPIKMEYLRTEFISTIGNINWYCGYFVTIFFGVMYYWWAGAENKKWLKWPLVIYGLMGFATLVTQGSTSGFLTLAVMCVVFYLLSAERGWQMQRLWGMAVLLGGACTISFVLRKIFPERFNYPDALVGLLTDSPIAVLIPVISFCIYKIVQHWNRQKKYPAERMDKIGRILVRTVLGILALLVVGIVWNTRSPGILGKLSEVSLFTFDADWGSYRGATWIAGMQCWLDQDFMGKLVGIGPDSMVNYIHQGNNPEILEMVQNSWGTQRTLTNAHCEWLTILVNMGLFGAVAYAGMIVSAIMRYIKSGKGNNIVGACGICVLAYTVNNVVSFQQAMATSTMFLIMGIAEANMRKKPAPVVSVGRRSEVAEASAERMSEPAEANAERMSEPAEANAERMSEPAEISAESVSEIVEEVKTISPSEAGFGKRREKEEIYGTES